MVITLITVLTIYNMIYKSEKYLFTLNSKIYIYEKYYNEQRIHKFCVLINIQICMKKHEVYVISLFLNNVLLVNYVLIILSRRYINTNIIYVFCWIVHPIKYTCIQVHITSKNKHIYLCHKKDKQAQYTQKNKKTSTIYKT